ncbi:MAG: energy transducer TonB [Saprospiraceae bacterium]|nr:energy transducer TonB [Saprospiraceae bacterium]
MKISAVHISMILLLCALHFSAFAQSKTSFFEVCNSYTEKNERSICEKEKLLAFINSEISPYLNSVKTSGPDFSLWLYFDIEDLGVVHNIQIIESVQSIEKYARNELKPSKKFVAVRIPDFKSPGKFKVSFKVPANRLPASNPSELNIVEEGNEVFKVVEVMPRFPGCEHMNEADHLKEACAKEKMFEYIKKNLKYPEVAGINNIEGQALVQFIVEKDGSITEVKAVRDPGHGLGQAAVDVVESMNFMSEKWTPGTQKGKAVRVLYTLPVKFKL